MNLKKLSQLVGLKSKSKGGDGGSQAAAPPPPPSRWWYDKSGEAQEYRPISDTLPEDRYLSPTQANEKNPKAWLYDSKGNAVSNTFQSEIDAGNYDKSLNLGPKSEPYRYWYDQYGVQQGYAPSSTALPDGYYESSSQAPKSPNYQKAVPLNQVNPNLQVTGQEGNTLDLQAQKAKAQKRRQGEQASSLTMLGGSPEDKNLLGQ